MYRIEASCRKHTMNHSSLVATMREFGWTMTVEKGMCKIRADFETLPQAKEAKRLLEIRLHSVERIIRPNAPFAVTFTNAYWIRDSNDAT